MKHTVKITFANGDHLISTINGTKEEVHDYYINEIFNIGAVEDNMQKCIKVEFL